METFQYRYVKHLSENIKELILSFQYLAKGPENVLTGILFLKPVIYLFAKT